MQEIIGHSEKIHHIKETIEKVAPTDARVLITGQNGTGKELVARWIHQMSRRKDYPIVEVNCAAIPSELIESELFGHEKG
ncbi:MAG: sigma 54-interacting transcriptional regulator, partial [Saprospiraceae bacterium]|nr:sigma 54-interacting transcriptional regulator [Saprospiraceae bacterium]